MKKVAGTLRLALAQYRELAAFAQLSTDLDKTTRDQLTRGERMVEILKQNIFEPLPVEKQVAIIFAGGEGLLDDIDVRHVKDFEKGMYEFLDKRYAAILHEIAEKKTLTDELAAKLKKAITEYKTQFAANS